MFSLPALISSRFEAVVGVDPELRAATKPQFGHYQTNVAMRLAKQAGKPPREVAQEIVEKVDLAGITEPLEIAGPGFINIRVLTSVLAKVATDVLNDPNTGIEKVEHPQRVIVEYSSPNVAKQMHVGHLRSTIIGDCFTRVLTAIGEDVKRENHIGDWGRQFGMLVEQILDEGIDASKLSLAEAEALYKRANAHFKEDEQFAELSRERVVKLQHGDELTRRIWRQLIDVSKAGFNETYRRMGVLLDDGDVVGESFYNDDLPVIAEDLESRGLAKMDDGALVMFLPGFEAPAIIRNSAGGYGYFITDLATIRHRVQSGAQRIIYVVGSEQIFHFNQLFAAARLAGYLPDDVVAEHVPYGMVLGPDGKKFSTREGTAVTLNSLLDEAEEHAAPSIALAAIKYADLSNALQKDYAFDAERMSKTTGDTGPYLQYAHARVSGILRKADAEGFDRDAVTVAAEPEEQDLAIKLSRFGEVVDQVAETLQPHRLCTYLFELAQSLSVFYERCPVLKSEGEVRRSRLAMCQAVKQVLARGLDLLGIEAPERM